jgi:hypothetical protein
MSGIQITCRIAFLLVCCKSRDCAQHRADAQVFPTKPLPGFANSRAMRGTVALQAFFARAQALAKAQGRPLKWRMVRVPGVGHEFDRMAVAAVAHSRRAPVRAAANEPSNGSKTRPVRVRSAFTHTLSQARACRRFH